MDFDELNQMPIDSRFRWMYEQIKALQSPIAPLPQQEHSNVTSKPKVDRVELIRNRIETYLSSRWKDENEPIKMKELGAMFGRTATTNGCSYPDLINETKWKVQRLKTGGRILFPHGAQFSLETEETFVKELKIRRIIKGSPEALAEEALAEKRRSQGMTEEEIEDRIFAERGIETLDTSKVYPESREEEQRLRLEAEEAKKNKPPLSREELNKLKRKYGEDELNEDQYQEWLSRR